MRLRLACVDHQPLLNFSTAAHLLLLLTGIAAEPAAAHEQPIGPSRDLATAGIHCRISGGTDDRDVSATRQRPGVLDSVRALRTNAFQAARIAEPLSLLVQSPLSRAVLRSESPGVLPSPARVNSMDDERSRKCTDMYSSMWWQHVLTPLAS